MRDFIKKFYCRIKENKFKYFLLRISLAIVFAISISRITNYLVNDLVLKTPRPNLFTNLENSNFIYYIFSTGSLVFFSFIILTLIAVDFFSYTNYKKKK